MKKYGKLLEKRVDFNATLYCLWDLPFIVCCLFLKMKFC